MRPYLLVLLALALAAPVRAADVFDHYVNPVLDKLIQGKNVKQLDQLTPREREVLRLIARGYTYKEIARELFLSVKTIETHVSAVLRKLQLSNRHELGRWATDRRLL